MCSYIEAAEDEITVSAKRASVYVVNKIAYLHSESFPIPYIVHYMPFTLQKTHPVNKWPISAAASVYSAGGGRFWF